jgi:hypothetical protein
VTGLARTGRTAYVRALALAVACVMPATGAAQAATEGSVTGQVLLSPVALDLAIQPATARTGTWVAARVTLRNIGPTALGRITVRVRAAGGLVVRPAAARSVRGLGSGAATSLGWSLCGLAPGAYVVFAEASFGRVVVDSAARLLTVTPGQGTCAHARVR